MDQTGGGDAMTEIALALAMGFFSLMVLTMVSMGAGRAEEKTAAGKVQNQSQHQSQNKIMALRLAPASKDISAAATIRPGEQDILVIYYQQNFFDKNLKAISLDTLARDKRLILAISPSLSLNETLSVRAQFKRADVVVTPLNELWVQRLKGQ